MVTDQPMDGRTHPLIEMRGPLKTPLYASPTAGGDLYSYMNGGMTQNMQQNGDINTGNGNAATFIPIAANNLINR